MSPAQEGFLIGSFLGDNRLTVEENTSYPSFITYLERRVGIPPSATTVVLSLEWLGVAMEAGDYVTIEVTADDGFHWTELGRVEGPRDDTAFSQVSFDISAYKAAFTEIRFQNFMDASDGFDRVYVDNVQVAFDGVYADGASRPSQIGADQLHAEGITGSGVTVAVLDTGCTDAPRLDLAATEPRTTVQYDAIRDTGGCSTCTLYSNDSAGHGAHVTSLIMNSRSTARQLYNGIAPDADLVSVKAFDVSGAGTYADVIRGIDWVVANKDAYGIRVLNLLVQRAAAVPLLGRSAQPGGHGGLAGRASWSSPRPATAAPIR